MSDKVIPTSRSGNDLADMHLGTYRFFCVFAGVLGPAFGLVYKFTDPTALDPLWARSVLALLTLLLLVLSYTSVWVRGHFARLMQGVFYLTTFFYVGLTALNGFAPNYAFGMLFANTAVAIIFSLGLRRPAPLTRYLVLFVVTTVTAVLLVQGLQGTAVIIAICAASTAVIVYIAASARIRAEKKSTEASRHYHTLMEAANDAIFVADTSTNLLVSANHKAQQLVGRSLEEIRQMTPAELFPADERARYSALFDAHVFEQRPIPGDLFVMHRSGARTPVDVSAGLVDVEGRQLIQSIFRDATERQRYEEQLIQAKERAEDLLNLKTSLLNNISHELRTPLTSILGFAEILGEEGESEYREYARVIALSARRLHETVDSILNLAQIESGAVPFKPGTLDLGRRLDEAIALLRPLADQKGIGLRTAIRTGEAFAKIDETCLDRILNNLVGNAIKFTERGQVTVELDGDAERLYLRVRDTGIGISQGFLPHLFDEFRQESTGMDRSHEGNGLGLAITRRLVELMRGTIEVESEKGQGTLFTVTFPRVVPEPAQVLEHPDGVASSEGASQGASARRKLLVVEDSPHTRALLKRQLERAYDLEAAADPETAFALARRTRFDAFLLDINLSAAQDGLDVLRGLRQMPGYAGTPSLALTAYAMPGARERFLEAGFDHYLSKPFTKQQLFQVLQQLVPGEPAHATAAQDAAPPRYRRAS